jgi:uncharacterized repeat protein (TIGR04052 family)
MHTNKNTFFKLLNSIAGLALASVMNTSTAADVAVEVKFAAVVNGEAFECGKSYANIGTTKSTITPSDFRFFVSEIHLIDAKGHAIPVKLTQDKVWQLDNLALLDFENGSGPCKNGTKPTNTSVKGSITAGDYKGLRITLGVPFNMNHQDPTLAASPLSSTAMFWTWQGGYKFLKFDAATTGQPLTTAAPAANGGGNASGFSIHLGSTMCAAPSKTSPPTSCQNPNRLTVTFDKFDLSKQIVVADIGAVLARANVDINAPGTSPGCMSFLKDADCPPVMSALGLPYEGQAAGTQQFFTVK